MPIQPLSSERLTAHIQQIVAKKHMSYLDAVLYVCDQRNIEPEIIAPLLGEKIRAELAEDAQRLHFIPKQSHLPC